jgi:hypothetical protein
MSARRWTTDKARRIIHLYMARHHGSRCHPGRSDKRNAARTAGQKRKFQQEGRFRAKPARREGNDRMDGNGRSERI